uniref:YceI domain-containing protein n=1 Tax=Panagrellus redivivus TaxID=6233 RepID=A0A7E4ZSM3_PANRE
MRFFTSAVLIAMLFAVMSMTTYAANAGTGAKKAVFDRVEISNFVFKEKVKQAPRASRHLKVKDAEVKLTKI